MIQRERGFFIYSLIAFYSIVEIVTSENSFM